MIRVSVVLVTFSVLFQASWISAKHVKAKHNVGVYGGNFINIDDAPWMALVYTSESTPCSGTIINPRFVLTIDTCCNDHGQSRKHWHVRVASDGRVEPGFSVNIQKAFPYTNPEIDYKLKPVPCLLQLESPLEYNKKVQPASLEEPEIVIENGTKVDFVAYGRPTPRDETRGLRRSQLPIDDADWCKDENKRLGGGQICAGDHEHNACAGDAGGALISENNLIGILSQAESDCKSNPSRFCRISHYRNWITQVVQENQ